MWNPPITHGNSKTGWPFADGPAVKMPVEKNRPWFVLVKMSRVVFVLLFYSKFLYYDVRIVSIFVKKNLSLHFRRLLSVLLLMLLLLVVMVCVCVFLQICFHSSGIPHQSMITSLSLLSVNIVFVLQSLHTSKSMGFVSQGFRCFQGKAKSCSGKLAFVQRKRHVGTYPKLLSISLLFCTRWHQINF